MEHVEKEVVAAAQTLYEQRNYGQLKGFICANHTRCDTDEAKLKLLRLWEDAVYQEFAEQKVGASPADGASAAPVDGKSVLSSSMRYKLRKKYPCPVELEHELRVKNARLPKNVHDGLNGWLKRHRDNPYPNKAEKDALSSKLGITPQQVNRWFIQRRKMLRIRGGMYLGRGITDAGSDDEYVDHEELSNSSEGASFHDSQLNHPHHHQHHQHHDSHNNNVLLLVPAEQGAQPIKRGEHLDYPSLLEKILSSPRSSPNPMQQQQQQIISKALCSGGSVEVTERLRQAAAAVAAATGGELPLTLTPPPSISGESNARSTPPEVSGYTDLHYIAAAAAAAAENRGEAPLDLSASRQQQMIRQTVAVPKASPVILEPVSPSWRVQAGLAPASSSELFYYKPELKEDSHYNDDKPTVQEQQQQNFELGSAERIAVNALLALGKAH